MKITVDDRGFNNTVNVYDLHQDVRAQPDQIEYAGQVAASIRKRLSPEVQRVIEVVNFRFYLVGGHSGHPHQAATVYTPDYFELEVRAKLDIQHVGSTANLEASVRLTLKDGWPKHDSKKKTVDDAVEVFVEGLRKALLQCHASIARYAGSLQAFVEKIPQLLPTR